MATPVGTSISLTGTNYIDGILTTSSWGGGGSASLTYAFYDDEDGSWSDTQKAQVGVGLQQIANVANITFTEITGTGDYLTSNADMAFGFNLDDPDSYAQANFPDPDYETLAIQDEFGLTRDSYPNPEGDVLFNANNPQMAGALVLGSEGFMVAMHEVGHAIGLKHPHDGGPNEEFPERTQTLTYEAYGIQEMDNGLYTFMSYSNTFQDDSSAGYAIGPMINDIEALQHIYGANTSYNAGDTVYTLSDNSQVQAIWDAGGTDTFDASAMTTAASIDLGGGGFSWLGELSVVSIGRQVTIEFARGGSEADRVVGNAEANSVWGNDGGDTVSGLGGGDLIYGNQSDDLIYGNAESDTLFGGQADDTLYGGQAGDVVYGNLAADRVFGGASDDTIYGGQGDDTLLGEAGADSIFGNDGADEISGGAGDDILAGGGGNDVFVYFEGSGNDTISDFVSGADNLAIDLELAGALGSRSESDFLAAATDSSGGTVFSLSDGGTITLSGISKSTLSVSDFYFI